MAGQEDLELKIMANLSDLLAARIARKGRKLGAEGEEGEDDLPMSPWLVTPDTEEEKEAKGKGGKTDHTSKVGDKRPSLEKGKTPEKPRESMKAEK